MGIKAWYKFDNDNKDSVGKNITLTSTGSYVQGKTTYALDLDSNGSGIISPSVSEMDFNNNVSPVYLGGLPNVEMLEDIWNKFPICLVDYDSTVDT